MAPALPALTPDELDWLRSAVDQYVTDQTAHLRSMCGDPDAHIKGLHAFTATMITLEGLQRRKIIRPEDRVTLMLLLRHERRRLLDKGDPEDQAVVDFINRQLNRLAQIDWEAYTSFGQQAPPYNPTEYWGSFRITETAMYAMLSTSGHYATFPHSHLMIGRGAEVTFTVEHVDGAVTPRTITIRITRIRPSETCWDGDDAAGMMFEGEVVGEPLDPNNDGSGEAFGFVFSNGRALITDNSPDSDYTERHVRASLAVTES